MKAQYWHQYWSLMCVWKYMCRHIYIQLYTYISWNTQSQTQSPVSVGFRFKLKLEGWHGGICFLPWPDPNYENFHLIHFSPLQQLSLAWLLLLSVARVRHLEADSWAPWWKIPSSIIHLDLANSPPPITCQSYSFTIVRTYHKIDLCALSFGYTNLFFFSETVLLRGEVIASSQGCEKVMRMYLIYTLCLPFGSSVFVSTFWIFPKGALNSSKIFHI